MKVIPFEYKGIKFRSKLEARWAAFFDEMGFDWIYEPETYDLGDGLWYIPDFLLLPGDVFECFLEVKPCGFNEKEILKARKLAKLSKRKVILGIDIPDYYNYSFTEWLQEEERFIEDVKGYDNTLIFVEKDKKFHPFFYASGWEDGNEDIKNYMGSKGVNSARSLKYEYPKKDFDTPLDY